MKSMRSMTTGVWQSKRPGRTARTPRPPRPPPVELTREVDEVAGPRGRSAYVAEAVRYRLKRDKLRRVLDETFGVTVGTSEWRSPDEVYRWGRSPRGGR